MQDFCHYDRPGDESKQTCFCGVLPRVSPLVPQPEIPERRGKQARAFPPSFLPPFGHSFGRTERRLPARGSGDSEARPEEGGGAVRCDAQVGWKAGWPADPCPLPSAPEA